MYTTSLVTFVLLWQDTRTKAIDKEFILSIQFQWVRVHDHHDQEHDSREAWHWSCTIHWEEIAWSSSKTQRGLIRNGIGFWHPKVIPLVHTSSNKATPANSATFWAKHLQITTTSYEKFCCHLLYLTVMKETEASILITYSQTLSQWKNGKSEIIEVLISRINYICRIKQILYIHTHRINIKSCYWVQKSKRFLRSQDYLKVDYQLSKM